MVTVRELQLFAEISEAVSNEWSQESVLHRACAAAVDILGVEHSGLVIFDEVTGLGVVKAEHPENFGAANALVQTQGIQAEQKLLREGVEIDYPDLGSAESIAELGQVREELWKRGVRGILAVPIRRAGRVIGSLSLDSTVAGRKYTEEEKSKCRLLASVVANALQNIHLAPVVDEIATAMLRDLPPADIEKHVRETAKRFLGAASVDLQLGNTGGLPAAIGVRASRAEGEEMREISARLGPKDCPAGVLIVRFPRSHEVTAENIRMLEHLARYSYVAFERARVIEREKLLRTLGDILYEENNDMAKALQDLAWVIAAFFEASLCRILVSDNRGVLFHDVAADPKGQVPLQVRPELGSGNLPPLLTLLRATAGGSGPIAICDSSNTGRAQMAPILEALGREAGPVPPGGAWLFPLRPTPEVQAWLLLADAHAAELIEYREPGQNATDVARRLESFIARTYLQAAEHRRQELASRLNSLFAESSEELSFDEHCSEMARSAAKLLEADGAALMLVRPEVRRMIRLGECVHQGPGLPPEAVLAPELLETFRLDRPSLVPKSQRIGEAWGEAFCAEVGGVAFAPLRVASPDNTHALIVWRRARGSDGREVFSKGEMDILGLYAARGSVLLTRVRSDDLGVQPSQLELLSTFAAFAMNEEEPRNIYRACLTAVTAGYGLRFNRAAILLLSGSATAPQLYGEEGIGTMTLDSAESEWAHFREHGPTTYRSYLDTLRAGSGKPTQLGVRITDLRLAISGGANDPFYDAVEKGAAQVYRSGDFPETFRRTWYGRHSGDLTGEETVAVVPLRRTRLSQVAGVLVADNWHTAAPIEMRKVNLLDRFASVAAEAAVSRGSRAAGGDTAGVEPVQHADPDQVLRDLLAHLRRPYPDSGAAVILATEDNRTRSYITEGMQRPEDVGQVMRAGGISQRVMQTGRMEVIGDRRLRDDLNTNVGRDAFRASVCFPLEDDGGRMGVVWLHLVDPLDAAEFERAGGISLGQKVRRFADVYRRSWNAREEQLRSEFKRRIGAPGDPRVAERAIVGAAQELLGAKTCVLFPVQTGRKQFVDSRTVVAPDSPDPVALPRLGDAAFEALQSGYSCRETVPESEKPHLPDGTGSLEAVELSEAGVSIAVLMLGYETQRVFDRADRERLDRLASDASAVLHHAALAYSTGQYRRASEWCRLIDHSVALQDNLAVLAGHIRAETKADKVVLFSYDGSSRTLQHPPGVSGIEPENAQMIGRIGPNSSLYRLHRLGDPVFVPDLSQRAEFSTSIFAKREGVRSLALLPLRSGEDTAAGLMFLNYLTCQPFERDVKERLQSAAQALTEAVRLAQFHAGERRLRERQERLITVGRVLAQCETADRVNEVVLSTAMNLFAGIQYANVIVIEPDGGLRQEAETGWTSDYPAGYAFRSDEAQHARFTIQTRSNSPIDDFTGQSPFPVPKAIRDRNILSGLGFPMVLGDRRVVGAMLVHTTERRHFNDSDCFFLRVLATEAAFWRERLRIEAAHQRALDLNLMALRRGDAESKMAAHQLSEPLNFLNTVIDLAIKGHFGDIQPRLAHKLDIARGGLHNCWRIAQGILGPELLEAIPPDVEPSRIGELILEVTSRWHAYAQALQKRIHVDMGNAVGELAYLDKFHLTLVLENLLSNAVRFARPNGLVGIVAAADDRIRIDIADDGPGFDPAVLGWLSGAEPDVPPPGRRSPGRLGKGLQITRQILNRYGGTLEAFPGTGGRLRVSLPRWSNGVS